MLTLLPQIEVKPMNLNDVKKFLHVTLQQTYPGVTGMDDSGGM